MRGPRRQGGAGGDDTAATMCEVAQRACVACSDRVAPVHVDGAHSGKVQEAIDVAALLHLERAGRAQVSGERGHARGARRVTEHQDLHSLTTRHAAAIVRRGPSGREPGPTLAGPVLLSRDARRYQASYSRTT